MHNPLFIVVVGDLLSNFRLSGNFPFRGLSSLRSFLGKHISLLGGGDPQRNSSNKAKVQCKSLKCYASLLVPHIEGLTPCRLLTSISYGNSPSFHSRCHWQRSLIIYKQWPQDGTMICLRQPLLVYLDRVQWFIEASAR